MSTTPEMIGCADFLRHAYGITADTITPVQGGWSADAYAVHAGTRRYFLKAYDKSRPSIAPLLQRMDGYLPVFDWLARHTPLQPHLPELHTTLGGAFKAETSRHIFLLFTFINGRTVAPRQPTATQLRDLARILAVLHSYNADITAPTQAIAEDTALLFCAALDSILAHPPAPLAPHRDTLLRAIATLRHWRDTRRLPCTDLALCHTDAHAANLMQDDRLILLDWENLILAPPEADLFIFHGTPLFTPFIETYSLCRPRHCLNIQLLAYYRLRRALEDICELTVQLTCDTSGDTATTLRLLRSECRKLPALLAL